MTYSLAVVNLARDPNPPSKNAVTRITALCRRRRGDGDRLPLYSVCEVTPPKTATSLRTTGEAET
jgi:hypothetical protein